MRARLTLFGWRLASALVLVAIPVTTRATPPELGTSCGQRGRVIFDPDTTLLDANGRKLARFSGGESAVRLLAPPRQGSDLVQLETGIGRGSFRLPGFVEAGKLRIFTSHAVPIVSNHVWLSPGTRVVLTGEAGGKVKLEKRMAAPFAQTFTGLIECSGLTFSPPPSSGAPAPGAARVFLMKVEQLELFAQVPPHGPPLIALRRAASLDAVRFFSSEQRGGFVHVGYHGDVNVDAWARASDLVPLPRGEAIDVTPVSYTLSSPPRLDLSPPPRVVKTSREVPLRLAATEAEAPVGVIEPETEVYVMDTNGAWAKVLPKSLHILPVDDQAFWAKTADLGS